MYVNRQRNRVFFHHCVSDADFGTWSTLSPPSKKKKKKDYSKRRKEEGCEEGTIRSNNNNNSKIQLTSKPTQNEYTR